MSISTLPQNVGINVSLEYTELPTTTFIIDWSARQIAGIGTGLDAMRQAVEIILANERFRWQIYDSNFGVELEELIGDDLEYIKAEIPRRIEEAFSTDSRILSVDNYIFTETSPSTLSVSFDVQTVYGAIQEEVSIGD